MYSKKELKLWANKHFPDFQSAVPRFSKSAIYSATSPIFSTYIKILRCYIFSVARSMKAGE